jgi:cyclic beta-1,2-glucan synthetase
MTEGLIGAARVGQAQLVESSGSVQGSGAALDLAFLANHARLASRGWLVTQRNMGSPFLAARCAESAQILADAAGVSKAPGSAEIPPLLRHQRLFASVAKEIQGALLWRRPVPQVGDGDSGRTLPRAYLVAQSYCAAAQYEFEEEAVRAYVVAVQENHPLEMTELWLLKPMIQLALLEAAADRVSSEPTAHDANYQAPLETVAKSLQGLAHASLKETFLLLSNTERILREDPARVYARMDFESCDMYRSAILDLGMGSQADEFTIARTAVGLAVSAKKQAFSDPRIADRRSHVGYYLLDEGRRALELQIGYRARGLARFRRLLREFPEIFYFLSIELLIFAMMVFILSGIPVGPPLIAAILLLLLPTSEAAIEVVNQLVNTFVPPKRLPRLDFSKGIPSDCLTMVAIPTLLMNEQQIRDLVRNVEIRYAGNRDPNLFFVLLTDPPDSSQRFDERDQYVSLCSSLIEDLNRKYSTDGISPFFHLHRHRVFNEVENKWMGWERKRGKLLDFNDFLRGCHDRFPVKVGDLSVLPRIRYVITLDSDTQLPRDSARRLVGTIAHPLNRAHINPQTNAVEQGYGILQPRVGISVQSANRSRLSYIYSGQTGLDAYTRAISNVYQDLFGEGSFTGKGIYEVDVFRRVLHDRFPTNAILSHDLIEGAYARAGLVSEIEVIDDYPSHFSAHSRRKHRWIRGDWQIMRWLLPSVPDARGRSVKNPLSFISRWKILDNLRRSVIEAATFILFLAAWFYLPSPSYWTLAAVALLLIPSYVQLISSSSRALSSDDLKSQLRQVLHDFVSSQINVFIFLAFLAHQTLVTLDAVFRTVVRLTITRRNLLEWETAAQSEMETRRRTPVDVYLDWTPALSMALGGLIAWLRPAALPAALPVLALWLFAKPVARWLDRPIRPRRSALSAEDERLLRDTALKTWRYFHQLSMPEGNWLVPDNLYEENWQLAHRISPTNLGLQFNAQYAAFELGFITVERFAKDTQRILDHAERLHRYRGHFLNWYTTASLAPDGQPFVSSVDSGNLACSLWVLKQGCLAAADEPVFRGELFKGLLNQLDAAVEALKKADYTLEFISPIDELRARATALSTDPVAWSEAIPELQSVLATALEALDRERSSDPHAHWWLSQSLSHLEDLRSICERFCPWVLSEFAAVRAQVGELLDRSILSEVALRQLPDFIARLEKKLAEYSFWQQEQGAKESLQGQLQASSSAAKELVGRLESLAASADALVAAMDFRFLYNEKRMMLSIGYNVEAQRQEASCYDLLASEARSAVFTAIAKGDIPQESWFQLSRAHTEAFGRHVLLSWTGTMFEYLMPTLWMKIYPETLLENSTSGAVACQKQKIANLNRIASLKVPWGASESACSRRTEVGHYEYRAFGLSELALNPELDPRLVIAPYASFLAINSDPTSVIQNLRRLQTLGMLGAFGYYESIDFGDARTRPAEPKYEIVRSWMAHHQGMSLLSIANLLSDGIFQRLFHNEILVATTERVLHERRPIFPSVKSRTRQPPPDTAQTAA